MPDRYEGSPLLRLVELYVLDSIGELPGEDRERLEAMTPEIAQSVGSSAETWQAVIADALDLPAGYQDSLRADWQSSRAAAEAVGHELDSESFAATVADMFVAN